MVNVQGQAFTVNVRHDLIIIIKRLWDSCSHPQKDMIEVIL